MMSLAHRQTYGVDRIFAMIFSYLLCHIRLLLLLLSSHSSNCVCDVSFVLLLDLMSENFFLVAALLIYIFFSFFHLKFINSFLGSQVYLFDVRSFHRRDWFSNNCFCFHLYNSNVCILCVSLVAA